jgi:hypothetical protein
MLSLVSKEIVSPSEIPTELKKMFVFSSTSLVLYSFLRGLLYLHLEHINYSHLSQYHLGRCNIFFQNEIYNMVLRPMEKMIAYLSKFKYSNIQGFWFWVWACIGLSICA